MRIDRSAIKSNAKQAIGESSPSPLLVLLAYLAVSWILNFLSIRILYGDLFERIFSAGDIEEAFAHFERYYVTTSATASLLSLAISLILGILAVGVAAYALRVCRRQEAGFSNLLDGFAMFLRVLALIFLMGLFVVLWTCLFWIPGIVASYRYRQAIYLLIDHPDWSALRCIRESKQLMRGRKGELFVLDLSFIGWQLLACIPFVNIWVLPYTEITFANYYDALVSSQAGDYGAPPSGGYSVGGMPQQSFGDMPPANDTQPPHGGSYRDGKREQDGDYKPPWEL